VPGAHRDKDRTRMPVLGTSAARAMADEPAEAGVLCPVCGMPTSVDIDDVTICSCGRSLCTSCVLTCTGCSGPCCNHCVLVQGEYDVLRCGYCVASDDGDDAPVDPVLRERVGRFVDALPDAVSGDPCSICTDDVVAPLKCLHRNHNFRRECLCTWFEMGQLTCPLCRVPFVLPP
jgi:hypothetical protein